MLKAVLDTNVVISAHLIPDGRQALILGLACGKRFRWFVSREILAEYEGVLLRERFGLSPRHIAESLRELSRSYELVTPRKKVHACADPDDDKFIECALEARADYVVTGNMRHFPPRYQDIRVISPKQFITYLAAELS
jgi:putative PIN family toxin of toxin-antitoxin system